MKKLILFFITIVIMLSLCTSVCFAADDAIPQPQESDTVESEVVYEDTAETNETLLMLLQRIEEYVETYNGEILGVLGDGIILIVALLIKSRAAFIKKEATKTNESQNSVVDVVNNMVDGYNALKESYDTYGETENDRNRVVGAVLATNTAILEILTMVYTNSKNLPQGVKDLVNLKYANCLKTLDDDEKVKAIVTAVRENIGTTMLVAHKIDNNTEV
jgi:hypothetical protein